MELRISIPARPSRYEQFKKSLRRRFNEKQITRIDRAYRLAEEIHANDPPRDDGTPYIEHPLEAAQIYIRELGGRNVRVIIGILLHDVSERQIRELTHASYARRFGREAALDHEAVTKKPKGLETTREYLLRIVARGWWAIGIKLCDRLHNLRTLAGVTSEKRRHQIQETLECHLPILIPALRTSNPKLADLLEWKILVAIESAKLLPPK